MADLLHQFVPEGIRAAQMIAFGLRNVVGGAERQRLEADLGVPQRQRRGHDDDEIALLRQQQRQRGDAVHIRHLDVEDHGVGIDPLDLVDGVETGAAGRRHHHVGFGFDPARDDTADDG
ncbi:hypothetical protein BN961_02587 [Afipia felis]|uniref:Uncharacterized protein n=1 Tax=Afipia felis TaxID=1035 RepID=A0A090MP42_AFIFE|nr:hypothetical protein BN961_02587 [Afipia felis]